jgi:type IV pilus assembly protein PilC
MARFCRTMSILIEAGTPIIETIVVSSETIQNVHYYNTLRRVASQVERGMPMSVQIRREPLFPAIVAQMMVVGEQTGKMGVVMEKMAEFYERETENLIKGIASLIEPLLIVIIGLGVGFLVYSIIFPIYNIASLNL